MDSYLDLATTVLRQVRRPLDARQILKTAYQLNIVPRDLYGKTQHKTLHARIAESMRGGHPRSAFVRTAPGRFFLRSFLDDPNIPTQYKREYPARPRAEQLRNFSVACFQRVHAPYFPPRTLLGRDTLDQVPIESRSVSQVGSDATYLFLRTFVINKRLSHIAVRRSVYGLRDGMGSKLSFGCLGYIKSDDRTMFSNEATGAVDASLRTASEQLDLPAADIDVIRRKYLIRILGLLVAPEDAKENSITAIVVCDWPENLDPIARYVGGGALYWHPVEARFNDAGALDIWSREVFGLGVLDRLSTCSGSSSA
jgi:hypothetical protein